MSARGAAGDAFRADPTDPRHGTMNGYHNLRCRCDRCRKGWSDYCITRRQRRTQRLASSSVAHGSTSTYWNHNCRCDECRVARNAYERERRRRSAS